MKTNKQQGFTLIELLVAMMIFAVLGTVAYQGLFQIQRVRDGVQVQSDQLAQLRRTFYWLSNDFAQIADRPIRSSVGSSISALEATDQGDAFIAFTRAGWTNPAADVLPPRSSLQRVSYAVEGDQLFRRYNYHLDQADEDALKRRLLLSNVSDYSVRFLDAQGEWHNNWPPATSEPDDPSMPLAVELNLELESQGRISRLFGLPG